MLLLLFETKEGRYALPTKLIVEVVPMVKLKKIPKVSPYVLGMLNYRGLAVPVLDLCALLEDENNPCDPKFSTRIIIINYPAENHENKSIGLVAEHVTETIKVKDSASQSSGILLDEDLYSTFKNRDKDEMIQWFDLKRYVPEGIVAELFQD